MGRDKQMYQQQCLVQIQKKIWTITEETIHFCEMYAGHKIPSEQAL